MQWKKVHVPYAQAILQSHSPSEVTVTNFNFSNPERGGGTSVQVHWKSVLKKQGRQLVTLVKILQNPRIRTLASRPCSDLRSGSYPISY